MNHPKGLTVDDRGNIYIADTKNMAIRKITDSGKNLSKFLVVKERNFFCNECVKKLSNHGNKTFFKMSHPPKCMKFWHSSHLLL